MQVWVDTCVVGCEALHKCTSRQTAPAAIGRTTTASRAAHLSGFRRRGQTRFRSPKQSCLKRRRRPPSRSSARQLTTLRPAHVSIQRGDARLRKERSEWANPLKITNTCSRQDCIRSFKEHMRKQPELLARQPKLREKILVCHCDDNQALHADVLRSSFLRESPATRQIDVRRCL